MGYYQGDYYEGDYHMGGLPFLALGAGLLRKAVPAGLKLLKGKGKQLAQQMRRPSPIFARTVAGGAAAAAALPVARRLAGAGMIPPGRVPVPGFKGALQRFLPGGATGFTKRRSMNTLNPKALSRAIRRLEGFRSKAVKALQAQGFTVRRRGGTSLNRRGQMACGCPKGKCVC